ncbi:TVP38/TMEM64 family protein [Rhodococcus marinonascens]|uniref:TVP38/TMEM64 family protein n=1 Tax=Rhodococcus marinonascens TaxID=38311 RepID=UPI0009355518|nr:TVP38/TMEM64 family protein [Rhodococcus marinonascens]
MDVQEKTAIGERSGWDYRLKLGILAVIVLGGAVVAITVDVPDPASLRDQVSAAGVWGMILFVLLYAVTTLTPFPASALTVASGLLFGLAAGVLVVVIAATLGAWTAYWVARSLGRGGVARIEWSKVRALNSLLERRGLTSVLIVRLVPLFPFGLVNYAAGLSAVRQRDYVIGTAVGIIPATIGYTALGAYGTSPLSWPFALAVLAIILLSVGTGYVARRMGFTRADNNEGTNNEGTNNEGTEAGGQDDRPLPA